MHIVPSKCSFVLSNIEIGITDYVIFSIVNEVSIYIANFEKNISCFEDSCTYIQIVHD